MPPFLRTSRPRFWIYLLGPYLLGWTASGFASGITPSDWLLFFLGLGFFSLPANLFIYGINDLHDAETDRLNPKKQGYEHLLQATGHASLRRSFFVIGGLGLALLLAIGLTQSLFQTLEALIGILGCLFLAWQYSAPPIRAKARPFLDSLFNGLYLFPALVGHALMNTEGRFPNLLAILAAWSWCAAMHAFSAIPDIEADAQAGLETIATRLGKRKTLAVCAALYLFACLVSSLWLGGLGIVGAGIYLGLLILAEWSKGSAELLHIYRLFPYVNAALGFLAWLKLLLN